MVHRNERMILIAFHCNDFISAENVTETGSSTRDSFVAGLRETDLRVRANCKLGNT